MSLADRVRAGDRLALARLVTLIENENPEGDLALNDLYSNTGRAHLVGVTGGTGTGKSTLVNQLALYLRRTPLAALASDNADCRAIGIIAVDPSSPFTGGAILGDRIRMRDLAGDAGVFIRSMASRGALGGLAKRTNAVVEALDAAGYPLILIETVGAGQSEVEIARTAHTTLVIDSPGLGDDVQAIKAGILEIADILVVNKADLPGAQKTVRALRTALEMGYPASSRRRGEQGLIDIPEGDKPWVPPLVETIATEGKGIDELAKAILTHREYLSRSGEIEARLRERVEAEIETLLRDRLRDRLFEGRSEGAYEAAVEAVLARACSPRQAVDDLVSSLFPA